MKGERYGRTRNVCQEQKEGKGRKETGRSLAEDRRGLVWAEKE
jgi:hypothetical protein